MTSVRRRRRLVTVLVLLALASPAVRDRDSHPLSTYPMYASARPQVAAFPTVVGVDDGGEQVRLSLQAIARTDDALIGQSRVRRAIAGDAADALCAEVAGRVAGDVEQLEVVTERHDIVELATGGESLLARDVHARCEVAR
jgi:hypothetical protein